MVDKKNQVDETISILQPKGLGSESESEELNSSHSTFQTYKIIVPPVSGNWTEEEENRVKRKADWIVMPLLILGFFALQLDRGNISNALTGTILEDLNITEDQVNVGNQLLYVGIVLGEIPSNYVLQRVGPRNWISCQIVVWGLVAFCQAFIQNYAGFLVTRIILGFCESGFICAGLYCISYWYRKDELGKRHSLYYFGNYGASCISGYIAGGLLEIKVWNGWRWLFLVEGIFTMVIGVFFSLIFPQSTTDTSPFWAPKLQLFNKRERYILTNRLLLDDPIKALNLRRHMSLGDIKRGLLKWRIWYHGIISFVNNGPYGALSTYYPTLIKSMGYTQFQANALSSVAYWIGLVFSFSANTQADYFKPRAIPVMFWSIWQLSFAIAFRCINGSASYHARYAVLTLLMSSTMVIHILNTYWVSLNAATPTDRSIALAMNISLVNMGNIYGNQLFRSSDAPAYKHGMLVIIILFIIGFFLILFNMIQYYWTNKQLDKKYPAVSIDRGVNSYSKDEHGFIVVDFTKNANVDYDEVYRKFRYSP
ncbi:hypothetical protein PACTADRAFT_75249 [Pachysolen tannophilus NRRL Y-2460]|uniref:Major facilitator superfamily (MFS) profile domain-containing protein n=1 Tax=Pachysolen tannophilus NRRL Y-2460 TaxID=669874 RepID=A0A1E4TWC8_PACTA|nr:hypothetical protein PACTADRAFT_75249 [Pachysolen tannophilus NRRL Y-2460]